MAAKECPMARNGECMGDFLEEVFLKDKQGGLCNAYW